MGPRNPLYNDLAWLWSMWEGVEEYGSETEHCAQLMTRFAETEVLVQEPQPLDPGSVLVL